MICVCVFCLFERCIIRISFLLSRAYQSLVAHAHNTKFCSPFNCDKSIRIQVLLKKNTSKFFIYPILGKRESTFCVLSYFQRINVLPFGQFFFLNSPWYIFQIYHCHGNWNEAEEETKQADFQGIQLTAIVRWWWWRCKLISSMQKSLIKRMNKRIQCKLRTPFSFIASLLSNVQCIARSTQV